MFNFEGHTLGWWIVLSFKMLTPIIPQLTMTNTTILVKEQFQGLYDTIDHKD